MSALGPRLSRLVAVRLGAATLLATFAVALALAGSMLWPVEQAVVALSSLFAVALVDAATVRFANRFSLTADAHFALDAGLISAYVYATGGVTSPFTPLYALPVVAAAGVQYRRGSVRAALLASLCFVVIVAYQYFGRGPDRGLGFPALPPGDVAWVTVAINVFAFFAVAFLAGQLAENLRSADVAVEAASEKIADLEAFNRNVIDHLASGLTTMDAAGCVLTFNRAAAAITGWDRDVSGRPASEVLQLPEAFASGLSSDIDAADAERVQKSREHAHGAATVVS